MNSAYVTRKEIARDLGIDPKTLRRRLRESGILPGKGLIPAEKVKEIKIRLKVETQNQYDRVINEPADENFNKFDRSIPDSQ